MIEPEFVELVLDLAAIDPTRAEAAVRVQQARGVSFTTLAEEQLRRPNGWLAEFTDLENATRAHLREPPRTPAQMVERLAFLKIDPEALFLACTGDGARYLGYACLNVLESDREALVHGWTGVRPEARGQGLATALKLHAAAWAKVRGYRWIHTAPRRTNAASLRANAKVGYRPVSEVPAAIHTPDSAPRPG
jgi:GNAT superfamily N-acetyltransferase